MPNMDELRRQLKEDLKSVSSSDRTTKELAQNLIDLAKQYNQQTESLRQWDSLGRLIKVDAQAKETLLATHHKIAHGAAALLQYGDEALAPTVKKISELASENFNMLVRYAPSSQNMKNIEELEAESRALRLNVPDLAQFGTVGDNSSTRTVITYRDEKTDQPTTVLFTPEEYHEDPFKSLQAGFKKLAEHTTDQKKKDFFNGLLDSNNNVFSEYPMPGWPANDAKIISLYSACYSPSNGRYCSVDKCAECLCGCSNGLFSTKEEVINEIGAGALDAFARTLDKASLGVLNTPQFGDRSVGSRVDSRNSAMSTVAALLGMSDVIAESKEAVLVDSRGAEHRGTIMSKVDGMDAAHPTKEDLKYIKEDTVDKCAPSFVNDLSRLQVLDYICGQTDRHGRNIIYQFDKNHNLIGAKGIDNDLSFPSDEEKIRSENWKPLENLLVIPESTAIMVMNTAPDVLRYSLRGHGLSDAELDGAVIRLWKLQNYIMENQNWLVVPDERLGDIDVNRLANPAKLDGKKTIFYEAKRCLSPQMLKEKYDENLQKNETAWKVVGKTVLDDKNRATSEGIASWAANTKQLFALLDSGTKFYRGSSANYQNMQNAVQALDEYQRSVANRLMYARRPELTKLQNYSLDLAAVVTPADLKKIQALNEQVLKCARAYINGKFSSGERFEDYGEYTQNRIKIARKVLEQAEKGVTIRPSENKLSEEKTNIASRNLNKRCGMEELEMARARAGLPPVRQTMLFEHLKTATSANTSTGKIPHLSRSNSIYYNHTKRQQQPPRQSMGGQHHY